MFKYCRVTAIFVSSLASFFKVFFLFLLLLLLLFSRFVLRCSYLRGTRFCVVFFVLWKELAVRVAFVVSNSSSSSRTRRYCCCCCCRGRVWRSSSSSGRMRPRGCSCFAVAVAVAVSAAIFIPTLLSFFFSFFSASASSAHIFSHVDVPCWLEFYHRIIIIAVAVAVTTPVTAAAAALLLLYTFVSSSSLLASFCLCFFFLSDLYFYVITTVKSVSDRFLYIRDQKRSFSRSFDWTVLFYKLLYKIKRSSVIGLKLPSTPPQSPWPDKCTWLSEHDSKLPLNFTVHTTKYFSNLECVPVVK